MTATASHEQEDYGSASFEVSEPTGSGGYMIAVAAGRGAPPTPADAGSDDWGTALVTSTGATENEVSLYGNDGGTDDATWNRSTGEHGVVLVRDDSAASSPWTATSLNDNQGYATTITATAVDAADIDSGDFIAVLVWVAQETYAPTWPSGFTELIWDDIGNEGWWAGEIGVAYKYVTGHDDSTDYDPGDLTFSTSTYGDYLVMLVETAASGPQTGAASLTATATLAAAGRKTARGSASLTGTATLTAAGTGSGASADIKIQRGTTTVSVDGETVTLGDAVGSLDNAFVVLTCNRQTGSGDSTGNMEADDLSVQARLTATDTITFDRPATTPGIDQYVAWEVWEYVGAASGENEFIVRSRNDVTLTSATSATATLDNTPDDIDACIPFVNGVMTADTGNGANGLAVTAYLSDTDELTVEIGENDSNAKSAHVTTVEFTGSNWSVGHGIVTGQTADSGTIDLVTAAAGTGGSQFDVSDWTQAIIASWGHKGDGTNEALADNWPMLTPGGADNEVDYTFDANHDGSDDDIIVHVLDHADLTVTRFSSTSSTAGNTAVDVTSASLTDLEQSSVLVTATSSGGGTAYARGWRTVHLTSLTNVNFHCGRSGNTIASSIQVIDWTGVTSSGGGSTKQGAASLTATATLTAAGRKVARGAASLTATATLTAAGRKVARGAASLTGTATVTAEGARTAKGAASLTGTATLTAAGSSSSTKQGAASLTATATLTAAGRKVARGAASLTGTATLTAAGRKIARGAASLTGAATLTATGANLGGTKTGSSSLTATATVTAAGRKVARGAASLTGTATVTAEGARTAKGAASLTGTGTLTAAGRKIVRGSISLTGTATITAAGRVITAPFTVWIEPATETTRYGRAEPVTTFDAATEPDRTGRARPVVTFGVASPV